MREGIPDTEEEAYFSSYSDSPIKGKNVHRVLCCLEGRTGMPLDAVLEGSGLWFPTDEKP